MLKIEEIKRTKRETKIGLVMDRGAQRELVIAAMSMCFFHGRGLVVGIYGMSEFAHGKRGFWCWVYARERRCSRTGRTMPR